jgi:hypothetical protein
MAYYVINESTLSVRVIAWRIKDESLVQLLLTTHQTEAPHALLDVTLRKDIHGKALVPGVYEGIDVSVENRAGVATELRKNERGDKFLLINDLDLPN